jgi:glycolate oxidase FAD binding subunit
VIKNVAGYDLAKLFAGSFGTLGMILSVNVRLHPLPAATATALGTAADAATLAGAARILAAAPLELDALDVAWHAGRGGLLARAAGAEPGRRAERAATLMRSAGLERIEVTDDDDRLWARQRAGQRSAREALALARVTARPTALDSVLAAADAAGGTLVGRAALGESYVELDPDALSRLHQSLPSAARAVLLDRPPELEPWGELDAPALALMRSVKQRFDPTRTCNPGIYVGGI